MKEKIEQCTTCGAPMAASADGRIRECSHCGSRVQISIDGDQIAAGMALDLSDADAFMRRLAASLTHAFAEKAKITHANNIVILIELDLGKDMFVAQRDGRDIVAKHKKMVRGVALKNAILALDAWVAALAKAIAAHSNENARVANVLYQLGVN
jgi:hypothetical protein